MVGLSFGVVSYTSPPYLVPQPSITMLFYHVNQVWNGEGGPHVAIPIIFGLLALWSFYISLIKKHSLEDN